MPESTAQSTAPEVVPQTAPACEFCGTEIVLDPNLRECCHKQAAVHHTLQLDSARNASRHIIVLHKQVDALTDRVAALEAKFAELEAPVPYSRIASPEHRAEQSAKNRERSASLDALTKVKG